MFLSSLIFGSCELRLRGDVLPHRSARIGGITGERRQKRRSSDVLATFSPRSNIVPERNPVNHEFIDDLAD